MEHFTLEHTPAYIVKTFPKASDLFKVHQIDFCCGGDQPLKETFTLNSHLDESAVLSELNKAYGDWKKGDPKTIDWDAIPSSELVDHIVLYTPLLSNGGATCSRRVCYTYFSCSW